MKHVAPTNESSWIQSIGFDEQGIIEIKCKNGRVIRHHSGDGEELAITQDLHDQFVTADSPGKFYNKHIKGIYPIVRG